jgi:phosphate transport system substrate-binding protein
MNDEFLHALRRDPPPEFARELKRRLQRQPARSPRSPFVRTLIAMFLIGGVAMAAAMLLRNRDEPARVAAPVAQQAVPREPTREVKPAAASSPKQQATGGTKASPPADEPESEDLPVSFVASSLTRPLAEALVESATKYGRFARPRVMTMDDTEALRALCSNADFVMVSRRIADAELAQCRKWGVDIVEWKLGYQAVVLTAGLQADPTPLTPRDVFLALAKRIPDPAEPSRLIDNPNTTWHDVDPRFDYRRIDVLAPPDALTRALFAQLVMEAGCDTYPWIRNLKQNDRPRYVDICHQLRGDGRYREVEVGGRFITQQLWSEPDWLVVLGYRYYTEHRSELLGTKLEGPAATLATLTDGTYPAARPVYVYAQREHLDWISGARMFAYALSNVPGFGQLGSMRSQGLVPLNEDPPRAPSGRPELPPALESLKP